MNYPLLVKVCPYVDGKHHDEENCPPAERAGAPRNMVLIEEEPYRDRTNDLGQPIDEVIQRPCANIEKRVIVLVEFYIHLHIP